MPPVRPLLAPVPVAECVDGPRRFRLEADADERGAVALRLGLAKIARIGVDATVEPSGNASFRVRAELRARARRTCVVTLEEFDEEVRTAFDATFAPPDPRARPDGDGPEPIRDGALALGELAVEHLSLALDPYPRHPDAPPPGGADWIEGGPPESPLAAALRGRRGG